MSSYLITGGKPLNGETVIRGAKNASFKEIIASTLTDSEVLLSNLPKISDVSITNGILKNLGSEIIPIGEHSQKINSKNLKSFKLPQGVGEKSRSSIMFAPSLLHRFGKAIVPIPGGDKLGSRPLDRLFEALSQMNVKVDQTDKQIILSSDKIKATEYTFSKKSHTVTEMLVMTACLASGQTVLNNASREPEIDDLIQLLNKMGAKIVRNTNNPDQIIINGVTKLDGAFHDVIADRNEAVTFAVAALATKGSIEILKINPGIIKKFLETVSLMGAIIKEGYDEVYIAWEKPLKPVDIITTVEPGFMTDWQAIFSVLLTQAVGKSTVIEKIFPSRFQHMELLGKMGAKFSYFNPDTQGNPNYYDFNSASDKPEYFHGVTIYGPTRLIASEISTDDLRTGACATLAALTADGQSILHGAEYIKRGYEKLPERLRALGADIKYIKN